jgi:hypothetical protein
LSGFAQLMAPVGPVAEDYVADERMIVGAMGPFGSAKTTSTIRKIVQSPGLQRPSPRDGVRRVRWCAVRDTYGQLETNVMKSWFSWFPKEMGDFNGKEMRHTISFDVNRLDGKGTERWEVEMLFRAMGDLKAEDVLKGLELTGLWLNETDTLDKAVLTFGIGRIGRYPAERDGGCDYRAIVCDFNAPDEDNWTYDLFVEQDLGLSAEALAELQAVLGPRFGVGFHRQPGGREPGAENLRNLPTGYYSQMMLGMSENHIRRFVDNKFGAVRNGQPVYPEYNDEVHCSREPLTPVAGVPVFMALDGGSTPAAVFGQKVGDQVRVLGELVVFAPNKDIALEKIGPEAFGVECAEYWLAHFGKSPFGGAAGDPAMLYGDEYSDSFARLFWMAFVKRIGSAARGWKLKAAPVKGNRLPDRIEGVRRLLTNLPGGKPGLLVSKACKFLRRGFNSGYVIVRTQYSNGSGRWKDEPAKTDESHVHDALQYLVALITKRGVLADGGETRGRIERRNPRGRVDFGSGHFTHREAVR